MQLRDTKRRSCQLGGCLDLRLTTGLTKERTGTTWTSIITVKQMEKQQTTEIIEKNMKTYKRCEQAFNRGEVETAEEWIRLKAVPSPQEVELPVPKKGRRGGAKAAAKKQVPVPAPMRVEPECQEPKKGKPKSGRWDGYLRLSRPQVGALPAGKGATPLLTAPALERRRDDRRAAGKPTSVLLRP
ncbi:hypothetical protein EOD39_6309 [Acipenser ruthenus]|uniref:Uncharacterized protein n=1 Tax=Acipenser ruthenus TaxID=7906 RepID=A0A444UAJ9_ACIRT|nr:hypothetical protein EOD39_6309 [Acipenser ruthenus]